MESKVYINYVRLIYFVVLFMVYQSGLGLDPALDSVGIPSVRVAAVSGQTAVLLCHTSEDLGEKTITWLDPHLDELTVNGQRVVNDSRFSIKQVLPNKSYLLIHDVNRYDEGQYRCVINTQPVEINVVTLNVKEPPQIIDELSSASVVSVEAGESISLYCEVTGSPKPEVTWYRNMYMGKVDFRERLPNVGSVLTLNDVTRYGYNIYTCLADNGVLNPVSRTMIVDVVFSPYVHLTNKIIHQKPRKSTILQCVITANPMGQNNWEKGGEVINSGHGKYIDIYNDGQHTITMSLRIESIDPTEDYGEYTCVAENTQGQSMETMMLLDWPF